MLLAASRSEDASSHPEMTRAPSTESVSSAITVDCSGAQSSSSTPPTSIGDTASVASASMKLETPLPTPEEAPAGRSRRARASVSTYNVKVLSGTAVHAPKKYCKANDEQTRRRTISGDTLVGSFGLANSSTETVQKDMNRLVSAGIDALDLDWSAKKLPKSKSRIGLADSAKKSGPQKDQIPQKLTRSAGGKAESLAKKLSVLGKRGRQSVENGITKAKRELRNLADTNEYAGIETKPVVLEVWSNGKLVTGEPPKKKKKTKEAAASVPDAEDAQVVEKKVPVKRREKIWLTQGLYAGQDKADLDKWSKRLGKKKGQSKDTATSKPNSVLPDMMWHGKQLLETTRDFKLPYIVCSPLPPGQPKPDEWRKTSSNRFVGEAAAMWKKFTLFDSFNSKCVCKSERGCDEDCQNRIMLYECDDTNCGAGREHCSNRSFSNLQERRKGGGKYRIGVEVIKTADRGYGVRSNRCFDAHQIIVEYTGEIITEDECDRRMNEDYKDNDCYYLMSFDQNMIIDATKGSIARFVNHSCKPNCRMVKWIVAGKPRMALFAGDRPIMTGDELTYDYNFDPFSAKNVQECRCGSDNCRGILGPKAKDQKAVKESIKESVKAGVKSRVKAGKRKLKELLGDKDEDEDTRASKKRKIKAAKGVKRPASPSSKTATSKKVVKGAAKAVKKRVSTQLKTARKVVRTKRVIKKTAKAKLLETYGKGQMKLSSKNSSLTLVKGASSPSKAKAATVRRKAVAKNVVRTIRGRGKAAPRGTTGKTIRVVTGTEE